MNTFELEKRDILVQGNIANNYQVFRNKLEFRTYIPCDPNSRKKVYRPVFSGFREYPIFLGGGRISKIEFDIE